MNTIPVPWLLAILALLVMLSGFFSSSETALMALNRYRLRHRAHAGDRSAQRVLRLLDQPERVLGLILLGNNFVNILASSIATIVSLRFGAEFALAIGTGLLTLVILIFAEVAPKTMAARHPERIAYFAAAIYTPLLRVLYPLVWSVNLLSNGVLRLLSLDTRDGAQDALSAEELRSVLSQAEQRIPRQQLKMLRNLIDLSDVTVEDVIIPRNELVGLDLDDSWDEILQRITTSNHAILPVYRGDIDAIVGTINLRRLVDQLRRPNFSREDLEHQVARAYYVTENTNVMQQLLRFQQDRHQFGLVVDEYGDILGAVTVDDILEEIVGDMTQHATHQEIPDVRRLPNGMHEVDGSAALRLLQKQLDWDLPLDEAKTFNGLVMEQLQDIPSEGTSLVIAGRKIEIISVEEHAVRSAKVHPADSG